jgi:16S rRNA G966 N2-methylase RsmD
LHVSGEVERLTHYLFRFPAKFHPPVVRALLERYTSEGDVVLDPFCGSGTLMVEAAVSGRPSIGIDVDPIAVVVAQAKTHRYRASHLKGSADTLRAALADLPRSREEYERRTFADLDEAEYRAEVDSVREWVPAIPNLFHWFRRYVIVDLARILKTIAELDVPATHKRLFRVVFASIIRDSSNADPVPVSGLEVTAYMKERDAAGRLIDPFAGFERALRKTLISCEEFARRTKPGISAQVRLGDATRLAHRVDQSVDAVLCSPPYHGAVDYYRRHQLEMFWLGATETTDDRLDLLQRYIGRPKVAMRHPYVANGSLDTKLAQRWEQRIRQVSTERADAFRHYLVAMTKFFDSLGPLLPSGAPALLVVGHSTWNKSLIPTTGLFREISGDAFQLEEILWYPVKNRYMSYARHNGASIDKEYVLVLRRTGDD